MKNKFLGIICTLYSIFILFMFLFDKIKFFLAPNMQMYLKLSVVPLFIIGMVLVFSNNVSYKFKISDLLLLLPIILLIFTGDGRLSNSFASNRTTSFKTNNKVVKTVKKKVKKQEDDKKEDKIEDNNENDIKNIYFDVKDENYVGLSNYITFPDDFKNYENKTIKVRGFVVKEGPYIPDGYFALGKLTITCCAADAEFTGFIAKAINQDVKNDSWYEVEGTLKRVINDGMDEMYIEVSKMSEIDKSSEEQYVYPCYTYDDECKELAKYTINN